MILFSDETADSLYRGVLAEPDNDLQRLVLADRLEEIGQAERAEFIRIDCELAALPPKTPMTPAIRTMCRRRRALLWEHRSRWFPEFGRESYSHRKTIESIPSPNGLASLVARGFPAEVRAPLGWLRGGVCEGCYGAESHGFAGNGNWRRSECPTCQGTGRTPGHLRELVRRWPIQRVVVTDRGPQEDGGEWMWASATDTSTWRFDVHRESLLWDIARHLKGGRHHPETRSFVAQWWYPTREAAVTALSDALLQEAKEEMQ